MAKMIMVLSLIFTSIYNCKSEKTDLIFIESDESNDAISQEELDVSSNNLPFEPTHEWQIIKPGQSIPAGLHVRMNLQTGLKEAKILEGKTKSKIPQIPEKEYPIGNQIYSSEQLKKSLKAIKADDVVLMTEEEAGKTQAKFRNIDQLKKDLETLHLNIKSESEIVHDILKSYRKNGEPEKIMALQDLEYIVHKFDSAVDFVKMGGLDVILPDLNATSGKVRSLVAFTLGSAMQGNPKVQIASMEHNSLNNLLRMVTMDPEFTVRLRALYALSCLVRQFPFAQKSLVENGGVTTLAAILKEETNPEMHKLQLKVITLVQDLLTEQVLAKQYLKIDDVDEREKLIQYDNYNLAEALVSNGVCEHVPKLLNVPDIDTQEKVVGAMISMISHCQQQFTNVVPELRELVQNLRIKAAKEKDSLNDDDDDNYYLTLYSSVNTLLKILENKEKDEL